MKGSNLQQFGIYVLTNTICASILLPGYPCSGRMIGHEPNHINKTAHAFKPQNKRKLDKLNRQRIGRSCSVLMYICFKRKVRNPNKNQ